MSRKPDASTPASPDVAVEPPFPATPAEVEARFLDLAREWETHVSEAVVCSVPGALLRCDAFARLVEMGPAIIPLVFSRYHRYAESQVPWAILLTRVTGVNLDCLDEPREHDELRLQWMAWAEAHALPGHANSERDDPCQA